MRIIRLAELKPIKGIPYSSVWIRKLVADGKFPRPIALSSRRIGFIESEIDSWIADRAAERDAAAA
jgi:prophage regulatory protein